MHDHHMPTPMAMPLPINALIAKPYILRTPGPTHDAHNAYDAYDTRNAHDAHTIHKRRTHDAHTMYTVDT